MTLYLLVTLALALLMPENTIQIPTQEFIGSMMPWQAEVYYDVWRRPEVTHRVMTVHRRGRKTTLGLNVLIARALATPRTTHAYLGPTIRETVRVVVRDPQMLARYLPGAILSKPFNESSLYAEFKNGSILHIGGMDQPDRWRGTGCSTWWLDEFAMSRNGWEMYQAIIVPIIRDNGGMVFFSQTPRGRNHGWRAHQMGLAGGPDWAGWYLPATATGRFTREELASIAAELPSDLYAQEFGCQFLVGGGGVFKRVRECISGALEPCAIHKSGRQIGRYVMGIDVAKKQDWTVLTVIDRDRNHVVAFERFNQIAWDFQVERITALARAYNNALLVLDSTGVGDPVFDYLQRSGATVRPYQFTAQSKKALVEKLRIAIEQRRITFPEIAELVQELEDFDVQLSKAGNVTYGAPEGLHDDCVTSLGLAVEGLGSEVYDQSVYDAEAEEVARQDEAERREQRVTRRWGRSPARAKVMGWVDPQAGFDRIRRGG